VTVDPMATCNCGHPEKDHVPNGGPCRWSCNCRMFIDPDELQRLRAAKARQAGEIERMRLACRNLCRRAADHQESEAEGALTDERRRRHEYACDLVQSLADDIGKLSVEEVAALSEPTATEAKS